MRLDRRKTVALVVVVAVLVVFGVWKAVDVFRAPSGDPMEESLGPALPSDPQAAQSMMESERMGDYASGMDPAEVEKRHQARVAEYEKLVTKSKQDDPE